MFLNECTNLKADVFPVILSSIVHQITFYIINQCKTSQSLNLSKALLLMIASLTSIFFKDLPLQPPATPVFLPGCDLQRHRQFDMGSIERRRLTS